MPPNWQSQLVEGLKVKQSHCSTVCVLGYVCVCVHTRHMCVFVHMCVCMRVYLKSAARNRGLKNFSRHLCWFGCDRMANDTES